MKTNRIRHYFGHPKVGSTISGCMQNDVTMVLFCVSSSTFMKSTPSKIFVKRIYLNGGLESIWSRILFEAKAQWIIL